MVVLTADIVQHSVMLLSLHGGSVPSRDKNGQACFPVEKAWGVTNFHAFPTTFWLNSLTQ